MDEKMVDEIAKWVLIVGGVNWGLALFKMNLVEMLLGGFGMTMVAYGIVGAAGVWALLRELKVL